MKISKDRELIVGILGGMGPEATSDLFSKIIDYTPAQKDQENLKILVYNNPKIPDRTGAILGDGEDPLPALVESAQILENAGADFVVIPCNTAHYFFDELEKQVKIPVMNMIEESAQRITEQRPELKCVGLMGTTGTLQSGIYDRVFAEYGVEVIVPSASDRATVMEIIYSIKSRRETEQQKGMLTRIAHNLIDRGAEAVVLGCTELPLLFENRSFLYPLYIPQNILAERAVEVALGNGMQSPVKSD